MKRSVRNFVIRNDGTGDPVLSKRSHPVVDGVTEVTGKSMILSQREPGDGRSPAWSLAPPGQRDAALSRDTIYQTDGTRGILREREFPSTTVAPHVSSADTCDPATTPAIVWDPNETPINVGTEYTFFFGSSGSAPITYEVIFNGSSEQNSTATSWVHTLVEGDVLDKDGTGLGHVDIAVIARNACNSGGAEEAFSIMAQGSP